MEFGLDQEQRLMVDMVRSFVENERLPLEDEVEHTGEVPRELGREIQDGVRELGRASMALSVFRGRPSNILCAGNAGKRERCLRPCVRGDKIDALAMTEPDAGSDVRGMKTLARREHALGGGMGSDRREL